jgi:predicted nucleic acid-binding Zn ribbon protein
MRRNNAEQIGDMIRKFFRQNGLESPLNEYRLVEAWKDVVGPTIARYTSNLYIKNQILYVHLSSSVLRQELMMGRDMLVRNLNNHVGAQVIVNIIFR